MPVDSVRVEVSRRQRRWDAIDHLVNHDLKETEYRERYLPIPNPTDESEENKARYDNYVTRSVLYNYTKRTLEGLRGTVMEKPPEMTIPAGLSYIEEDIDGNGLSLEQQTRETLGNVLTKGRYGLLASYPNTENLRDEDGFISQETVMSLGVRAYATTYHPIDIINWQTDRIGAGVKTVLVVLREEYNASQDEFEVDIQHQYRVLRLGEMTEALQGEARVSVPEGSFVYHQFVYRDGEISEIHVPLMSNGEPFDEIPFRFVGSEDNSPTMDDIPLEDIAEVNLGHFRNSADFEEATFLVGQPQVYATGMTEHWIENVWEGSMYFGSRAVLTGPDGSTFGILQAQENSMPMAGMRYKEEVMVRLGAQLVTPDSSKRTATEALIDNRSDNSVLSSIAANVSDAYEDILRFMAMFNGDADTGIVYRLNQNYGARDATPEQINAWLGALAQNAMSLRTFLENMRQGNQLPSDTSVEDEMNEIENAMTGGTEPVDGLPDENPEGEV